MIMAGKVASVAAAGLVAFSLLGLAPVPKDSTYQDDYLFSEDGSTAVAHVQDKTYKVAWIPTVEIAHLYDEHPHYRSAIAVLDKKGKIVYFREMSTPKGVNAFGRYTEVKHSYKSLSLLESRLDSIIKHAANHY